MANDVIHYDTDCIESLHLGLNSIRSELQGQATGLRLINLVRSGADIHICRIPTVTLQTTGNKLSSALTPVLIHRIASAMFDLADHIAVLQHRLKEIAELFKACEQELAALTFPEPDSSPASSGSSASKDAHLEQILQMLKSAPKPEELSVVMFSKLFINNFFTQNALSSYSFITGNYSQMDSILNDLYNQTTYAYRSFFDGFVPEDFKFLTLDNILGLVPGDSEYDDIVNIFKIIGVAGEIKEFGPIGSILGAVGAVTNDVVNTVNQLRLLMCMDKSAALERAKVYQEVSDLSMNAVGLVMEKLVTGSIVDQLAILAGTTMVNASDSVVNAAAEITLEAALAVATAGASEAVFGAIGIVTTAADLALNTSSIPETLNNMTYSADIVSETYAVYFNALKAYEAYPTEANLNKVVSAYKTYQHVIADSYSALDSAIQNIAESNMGKKFNLENIDFLDQASRSSETHRQMAQNMNATYNQYSNL